MKHLLLSLLMFAVGGPGIVGAENIIITWDAQAVDVVAYEVDIDGVKTIVDVNSFQTVVDSSPHIITVQAIDNAGQRGPASDPKSNDPPPDKVENVVVEKVE